MPRFALALLIVAVALAGSARPEAGAAPLMAAKEPIPLVGVIRAGSLERLARVDPVTLRPLPGGRRPAVGRMMYAWALSPDRAEAVVALERGTFESRLRFVDMRRLRPRADVRIPANSWVESIVWASPERVLVVTAGARGPALLIVDVRTARLVNSRGLEGALVNVAASPHGLVVLLGGSERIGPTRLVAVDAQGGLRTTVLEELWSGWEVLDHQTHHAKQRIPGLALDPDGARAYVVDPGGLVAQVELASLTVSYQMPARPRSLLGRFVSWLLPKADAKTVEGSERSARWVRDGVLAVSGTDQSAERVDGEIRERAQGAGLMLIDTRTWTARTVDERSSSFRVDVNGLVAVSTVCERAVCRGDGVTVYGLDGSLRLHALTGKRAWIQELYDGRAYLSVSSESIRVLDVSTGAISVHAGQLPRLLIGASGPHLR